LADFCASIVALSKKTNIVKTAQETLLMESEAVAGLVEHIDSDFVAVIESLLVMKGRLVITGIGKSAIIAQKMVATFNSTGQPSLFMHAADAIHGDLGNVQKGDMVLCISKSGDSPEIKVLIPLLKSMGNKIIGMVGNSGSFLARQSDYVVKTPVSREACPNNLAPTTSTTAQMAMGDAIAVSLMECRGFTSGDFAKYHPGGALGKKLYVRMKDLIGNNSKPMVKPNTPVKEVILSITSGRLGATAVISGKKVLGIVTDGDIRRMLQNQVNLDELTASDIMTTTPKTIDSSELAVTGFQVMENHKITQLVVLRNEEYQGIVHLHDILKEGIF
jgi:arabinose-5-phosphate isomerase